MFIAALFPIVKIQKQSKYPSVNDWIKVIWYTYTMEYYSVTKKKYPAIGDNLDEPREHYAK